MTQVTEPFPIFYDDDGTPLENGMIYIGQANQDPRTNPVTVYRDEARTVPIAQPIITLDGRPAFQGAPVNLYIAEAEYSIAIQNRFGTPIVSAPNGSAFITSQELAASGGSDLVGFIQSGTGAVARTVQDKAREFLSVKDFGAIGDDVNDDTTHLQAAVSAAIAQGKSLFIPAGTYKTTATIIIPDEITIFGEGSQRSIIKLYTASASTFSIVVDVANNSSVIGLKLSNFGINAGGGSARGAGISIQTTATNSAVSNSIVENIYIRNVSTGVLLTGVIYMSTFRNITITGNVDDYGWLVTTVQEVIYNSFQDLEVTAVNDGAYAYYCTPTSASQWRNITADGCCYFGGAYTRVQGLSVEGIFAASPPSTSCIQINQIACLTDIALINIPNSKCSIGINVIAALETQISNIRVPDSGAGNQPNSIVFWQSGSKGVLRNVRCDRNVVTKLEVAMTDSVLNGWVIISCDDITDRALTYEEGNWTPEFAAWTIAPSVSGARYLKSGRRVDLFINANGGECVDYSTITGLPFAASPTAGGIATMASGDVAKNFVATIIQGTSTISNIPAQTLNTGPVFWQLQATYYTAS